MTLPRWTRWLAPESPLEPERTWATYDRFLSTLRDGPNYWPPGVTKDTTLFVRLDGFEGDREAWKRVWEITERASMAYADEHNQGISQPRPQRPSVAETSAELRALAAQRDEIEQASAMIAWSDLAREGMISDGWTTGDISFSSTTRGGGTPSSAPLSRNLAMLMASWPARTQFALSLAREMVGRSAALGIAPSGEILLTSAGAKFRETRFSHLIEFARKVLPELRSNFLNAIENRRTRGLQLLSPVGQIALETILAVELADKAGQTPLAEVLNLSLGLFALSHGPMLWDRTGLTLGVPCQDIEWCDLCGRSASPVLHAGWRRGGAPAGIVEWAGAKLCRPCAGREADRRLNPPPEKILRVSFRELYVVVSVPIPQERISDRPILPMTTQTPFPSNFANGTVAGWSRDEFGLPPLLITSRLVDVAVRPEAFQALARGTRVWFRMWGTLWTGISPDSNRSFDAVPSTRSPPSGAQRPIG